MEEAPKKRKPSQPSRHGHAKRQKLEEGLPAEYKKADPDKFKIFKEKIKECIRAALKPHWKRKKKINTKTRYKRIMQKLTINILRKEHGNLKFDSKKTPKQITKYVNAFIKKVPNADKES